MKFILITLFLLTACSKSDKTTQQSQIVNRQVASSTTGQQVMIDQIIQTIVSQIKVSNGKNNVVEVLTKIQQTYPMTTKDLDKMPVARLLLQALKFIPQFEGILWRLRRVAETSDFVHLGIIGSLRGFYQLDSLYGPHVKAFFHFLTTPTEKATYFANADEFMNFLNSVIKPQLKDFHNLMIALVEAQPDEAFDLDLDLRLFTGGNDQIRYLDPDYQRKRIIKPYFFGILSGLETSIATISYASNYHLNGLLLVSQKALAMSGINVLKDRILTTSGNDKSISATSVSKGITAKELAGLVNLQSELLTLRVQPEVAQKSLAEAYKYVNSAFKHKLKFYTCSLTYPSSYKASNCTQLPSNPSYVENGEDFLINPNLLLAHYKKHFHTFSERQRLIKESYDLFNKKDFDSTVEFVSEVTGNTVRLRPQRLFQPQKDLKIYFPKDDNYAVKEQGKFVQIKGKPEWAWNYKYGSAQSLPDFTFNGFFPDASDSASYMKIMRTVNLTPTTHNIKDIFFNISSSN